MNREELFKKYETLVEKADSAFERVHGKYPELVRCHPGCADCCHSVFGLFLIESVYIKLNFDKLPRKKRREALLRAEKYDKKMQDVESRLQEYNYDLKQKAQAMALERLRCPLLGDDNKCILYSSRPVTCRVYGIPTIINGMMHSCWMSGFTDRGDYPSFDLDACYRDLYALSREYLKRSGISEEEQASERASLLISVSRAIKTSPEDQTNIQGEN